MSARADQLREMQFITAVYRLQQLTSWTNYLPALVVTLSVAYKTVSRWSDHGAKCSVSTWHQLNLMWCFSNCHCMYSLLWSGLLDDIGFNFIKRCIAAVEARGKVLDVDVVCLSVSLSVHLSVCHHLCCIQQRAPLLIVMPGVVALYLNPSASLDLIDTLTNTLMNKCFWKHYHLQ